MSGAEARKSVSDVSHSNLDDWVRSQNFTNELEEVSQWLLIHSPQCLPLFVIASTN